MRRRHDRQSLLARDVLIINSRRRTFIHRSRSSFLSFTRERRFISSRVPFRLLYGSKCVVQVAGCTCTYPRTIIILSQSRLHRRRWWIRFFSFVFFIFIWFARGYLQCTKDSVATGIFVSIPIAAADQL